MPEREFITVEEFAQRVHRKKPTVYQWIREKRMPKGTVVDVMGHVEIDYTAWVKSIKAVD